MSLRGYVSSQLSGFPPVGLFVLFAISAAPHSSLVSAKAVKYSIVLPCVRELVADLRPVWLRRA